MSAARRDGEFSKTSEISSGSTRGTLLDENYSSSLDPLKTTEIPRPDSGNRFVENNPSEFSSSSSDDCDRNDSHNNDDRTNDESASQRNNSRQSRASTASLPSIFTAVDIENGPEKEYIDEPAAAAAASTVSTDQERQILLLMLLAQVCALHDATPRTFTVHVLELFERGILDRESIHFLFDLGLVPSISPTRRLLTNSSASSSVPPEDPSNAEQQQQQLMLTTAATTPLLTARQRSLEAGAIRTSLEQHDEHIQQQKQKQQRNKKQNGQQSNTWAGDNNKGGGSNATRWDVEHFPLSLSRYQREFDQISIISAGAFGQVYHVIRKMDGCDYAMKKVTFDATGFSDEGIDQVVREVQCLAKVSDHPNIVRYYTSWLEPGWMTGGTSSSPTTTGEDESTGTAPVQQQQQHQLVTDLQQLMKLQHRDAPSSHCTNDDMDFSSIKKGRGRNGRQRRRFSFGSSMASADQSWESYSDWSIGGRGISFDTSSIAGQNYRFEADSSHSNKRNHNRGSHGKEKQSRHSKVSPYRYQVNLFIQMQLCHPASLADYIRERNSKIPEADFHLRVGPALDIFRQIAAGLVHIHANGIIHRDLKPANIMASKDGSVIKIGDFGLSKCLNSSTFPLSKMDENPLSPKKNENTTKLHHHQYWQGNGTEGAIVPRVLLRNGAITDDIGISDPLTQGVGTVSYASPEQVKSRSYGTKADIFSLGLILLELLCCFETEHERYHNFMQCRQHRRLPGPITKQYPSIASLILACTRHNPVERPAARDLLRNLTTAADSKYRGSTSSAIVPYNPQIFPHNSMVASAPVQPTHSQFSPSMIKDAVIDKLQSEVEQQRNEIVEKDRIIESMRLELEGLKVAQSMRQSATSSDQAENPSSDHVKGGLEPQQRLH